MEQTQISQSVRHYKNESESEIVRVSICICPGLNHWIKVVRSTRC